jgi:hypothetical protein
MRDRFVFASGSRRICRDGGRSVTLRHLKSLKPGAFYHLSPTFPPATAAHRLFSFASTKKFRRSKTHQSKIHQKRQKTLHNRQNSTARGIAAVHLLTRKRIKTPGKPAFYPQIDAVRPVKCS